MKHFHRVRRDESGQAMVEFALILPIILLLMVGMLEFARAWNLHQVMTDAAREGARRAVLADATAPWGGMTQDSVKAAVWRAVSQAGYDPKAAGSSYQVTVSPVANWKQTGQNIAVSVRLPYRFWVLPFRQIMMRSTYTMRNE